MVFRSSFHFPPGLQWSSLTRVKLSGKLHTYVMRALCEVTRCTFVSFFPLKKWSEHQKTKVEGSGVFHSGGFSDRLELGKILEFEFETF